MTKKIVKSDAEKSVSVDAEVGPATKVELSKKAAFNAMRSNLFHAVLLKLLEREKVDHSKIVNQALKIADDSLAALGYN
jgi:hypothetical protein